MPKKHLSKLTRKIRLRTKKKKKKKKERIAGIFAQVLERDIVVPKCH